ncbi:hypothetical protein JK361_04320 [Streptomyces sp. 5-8]|uniref:Uncharacterized protein n=1 Tax=Streptomyces musisoli TaxID=2802280 RepID=A0ABS1NUR1_9ACTN|nr:MULTISPECIES: hypothetical protein [Streptomyces]MBL1103838.1 hypothetical protein [Streptomyces musisoli]MBY8843879.1 hypothetical protein [Streptomyces sp. SP2-10]
MIFGRVGRAAAVAWLTLPRWERAGVAMLNRAAVRTTLDPDSGVRLLAGCVTEDG